MLERVNGYPVVNTIPPGAEDKLTLPVNPSALDAPTTLDSFVSSGASALGLVVSDGRLYAPVDGSIGYVDPIQGGRFGSSVILYKVVMSNLDSVVFIMNGDASVEKTSGKVNRGDLIANLGSPLDGERTSGFSVVMVYQDPSGSAVSVGPDYFLNGEFTAYMPLHLGP